MLDSTGVTLSVEAFRKLSPVLRKQFKKHTSPIVYLSGGGSPAGQAQARFADVIAGAGLRPDVARYDGETIDSIPSRRIAMISGINHITWNVTDIENTFAFYVDVLGFTPVMKCEWSAYFLAGNAWIAVVKGERRDDARYDHIAFHIDSEDYSMLVSKLVNSGIRQWKENETEGESFYFLDPSGNKFELHYSDLESRIRDGKTNWGNGVTWYL
jgi:glutathione S-transferase fosA5